MRPNRIRRIIPHRRKMRQLGNLFNKNVIKNINCDKINDHKTNCYNSLESLSNLPGGPVLDNKFKSICVPYNKRYNECEQMLKKK